MSIFAFNQLNYTTWKVSKYGVFSGLYFPIFGPNTGKYGPQKAPYLDTFHAVLENSGFFTPFHPLIFQTVSENFNTVFGLQHRLSTFGFLHTILCLPFYFFTMAGIVAQITLLSRNLAISISKSAKHTYQIRSVYPDKLLYHVTSDN